CLCSLRLLRPRLHAEPRRRPRRGRGGPRPCPELRPRALPPRPLHGWGGFFGDARPLTSQLLKRLSYCPSSVASSLKHLKKRRTMRTKGFPLRAALGVRALLGLALTAGADQPVTTELHFDRTTAFPAGRFCPFAFTADTVGTFRETVYSDGKDVTHA